MSGKVFIGGYDSFADAEDRLQDLDIQFKLKVSARDNAIFINEFLTDLQKFIDEKYNQ